MQNEVVVETAGNVLRKLENNIRVEAESYMISQLLEINDVATFKTYYKKITGESCDLTKLEEKSLMVYIRCITLMR